MGSGGSSNDLRLRKLEASLITPSKYVYMPWWIPIRIKRKNWSCIDTNAAYKIATSINRMRESFSAMFAEMVPRIVFAHRLNAKGGKLKTPDSINKAWHEDDDF